MRILDTLKVAVVSIEVVGLLGAGSAAAQDDVVRIGGVGNYGPVLPVAAGMQLGLFEKAGVAVSFTNFAGGAAAMEGLAAGEADFINYFPPGLALAKRRGVDAKIVSAGTLTPRGWHIAVANNSDIDGIDDLVGNKIGVTANGSTTDFFAMWVADQAGGDINRIPLGGSGLVPNLLSGNVEAIVAYPPLSYRLLISGDGKSLLHLGEAMEPNLPDVWIASQELIEKNAEGLRKSLVGLYSAIVYMQNNPEWSIKFIQEKTGLDPKVAEAEYNNTIKGLSPDGNIKKSWVEASMALGRLAGLENLPPAEEMFTAQFVPVQTIEP